MNLGDLERRVERIEAHRRCSALDVDSAETRDAVRRRLGVMRARLGSRSIDQALHDDAMARAAHAVAVEQLRSAAALGAYAATLERLLGHIEKWHEAVGWAVAGVDEAVARGFVGDVEIWLGADARHGS